MQIKTMTQAHTSGSKFIQGFKPKKIGPGKCYRGDFIGQERIKFVTESEWLTYFLIRVENVELRFL